jgi:hypothetical protein
MYRPARVLTFALLILVLALTQTPVARGQNPVNGKDLERLMSNMYDDSKKFRTNFNSSISKSTIRKTYSEKQSKRVVEEFVQDIGVMRSQFRKKQNVDNTFPRVQMAAVQIDDLLHSVVQLDAQTNTAWAKVRAEFQQISEALHLPSGLH